MMIKINKKINLNNIGNRLTSFIKIVKLIIILEWVKHKEVKKKFIFENRKKLYKNNKKFNFAFVF
jgi:hypothetical protein